MPNPQPDAPAAPRRFAPRLSATQLVPLLLPFVLVAGTGGVLAAGFVLPLTTGAHRLTTKATAIMDEIPDVLERTPLAQASTVYAANGERLATFFAQNRIVVPLDQVSPHLQNAVVAI